MISRNPIAGVAGFCLLVSPGAAHAGIHTWDVGEVFSNADGTIQFVELVEAGGGNGETGVSGGTIPSEREELHLVQAPVTKRPSRATSSGRRRSRTSRERPPVDAHHAALGAAVLLRPARRHGRFRGLRQLYFPAIPTNGIGSRNCESNTNQTTNSPTNYAGGPAGRAR